MKNVPKQRLADVFIAPPCHEKIKILYEDDDLLVIDKPSGLLSLSGKNPANKDSVHYRLVNGFLLAEGSLLVEDSLSVEGSLLAEGFPLAKGSLLAQGYPTASMVHRLDFGTSGVMVIALNKDVNAHLTKQFQARAVEKTYLAILMGHVKNDEGFIHAPIAKGEFPYQKICYKTGKAAQSHYQVWERLVDANGVALSRVLFKPTTGRTHQLRVHSHELAHPIIGCDLYSLVLQGVDSQQLAERLMLHANRLVFDHPITGERLSIESINSLF